MGDRTGGVKIGIFGGTFDPVHLGHLVVAEEIREQFGLDKVIFVPAAQPPHKGPGSVTDPWVRYKMVALAIADNPHFEVSDIEIRHLGKSYTIDTIHELKDRYGPDYQIFFIMGADSLLEMPTWKDPEGILNSCAVIVTTRPGFDLNRVDPHYRNRVQLVRVTPIDISSTEIRRRVREGRSIKYLVPRKVEEYIHKERVY